MNGIYLGDNRVLIKPVWGGKLIVPSNDLSVSVDLIAYGEYEPHLTNYIRKNIKENFVAFDLGANVGYYTVLLGMLVGPKGQVIAYEANPKIYPILIDNLSINYMHDRVIVINKAAYSKDTFVSFYITNRFFGNSSIHQHSVDYHKYYNDSIEKTIIEAEPLDIHLNKFDHIDLIKMDIEGGEYQTFLGMRGIFNHQAVDTVIFEVNKNMMQNDWDSFCELLLEFRNNYGLEFYSLSWEGNLINVDIKEILNLGHHPHIVMKSKKSN